MQAAPSNSLFLKHSDPPQRNQKQLAPILLMGLDIHTYAAAISARSYSSPITTQYAIHLHRHQYARNSIQKLLKRHSRHERTLSILSCLARHLAIFRLIRLAYCQHTRPESAEAWEAAQYSCLDVLYGAAPDHCIDMTRQSMSLRLNIEYETIAISRLRHSARCQICTVLMALTSLDYVVSHGHSTKH